MAVASLALLQSHATRLARHALLATLRCWRLHAHKGVVLEQATAGFAQALLVSNADELPPAALTRLSRVLAALFAGGSAADASAAVLWRLCGGDAAGLARHWALLYEARDPHPAPHLDPHPDPQPSPSQP